MEGARKRATDDQKIAERESEATNDETLSELEKTEKIGEARKEREIPAPDSEPSGDRQKRDDAGPM